MTLQLLWEEYRETQPDGYRYSRFCELYQRWHRKQDVVLRQEHRAGEKMFVDWAGATIPIYDRETGGGPAGLAVRRRSGRQHLHLCARHTQPGPCQLGRVPRRGLRVLPGHQKLVVPDNPAHRRRLAPAAMSPI